MADSIRRRRWAQSLIGKAMVRPPTYGSETWLALPEGSAEKVAAVVVAAECWAVDGDDIEARLRRELSYRWHAEKHAEDWAWRENAAEHRKRWKHLRHLWLVPPRDPPRDLYDIGADAMRDYRNQGAK